MASNKHFGPLDEVNGFPVRPGDYSSNGATLVSGGVNFTIHSNGATSCTLLLFRRTEMEPYAQIPFPEHYKIGNVYSMIVFGLDIGEFEYAYRMEGPYEPSKGLIFDSSKYLLDPYARAVTGQSVWGKHSGMDSQYKARVVNDDFDWKNCKQPLIHMEDLVIYELHVRGFSIHESSGVSCPGTFAGLSEKIPYLKKLGITAVELMPIFEFDEIRDSREYDGKRLLDYWGYNSVGFFAPNTSYCSSIEYNHEGHELKETIALLNQNGIEVYLDVVFNHTAEGNENGPFFSFKGLDNNIYYLLTPTGAYYNFSGCGNTLNCNHPIVQQMILECLRYWVTEYRVDGFRFDLASILGRNEDGNPMNKPPLLQSLAFDPILGSIKLIAEAWDAGGLYQVGTFPDWNRWVEWNGRYRDDIRKFIKGDYGVIRDAASRIIGSPDIYSGRAKGQFSSINFINCHDGFTLHDLFTYDVKHNEQNGWKNTDGADDNNSWNCGTEGETDDKGIQSLRNRMMKNACTILFSSRGIPMFFAGDEFGNSQKGNNNAYCQDNEISWLNWNDLKENEELFTFFCNMIKFRKEHVILRRDTEECSLRFPTISIHGRNAWEQDFDVNNHYLGVMYAGRKEHSDDVIYVAMNTYWEPQTVTLPQLPSGRQWIIHIKTCEEGKSIVCDNRLTISDRTVLILLMK